MELTIQASPSRIILSFIMSMLGALCAISLNEMARITPEGRRKQYILFAVAFNIGGIAIWSMHFIGMSAWVLYVPGTDTQIPIQFEIVTTIISFIMAVLFVYIGIRIASQDRYFKEVLFSQKRTAITKDIAKANNSLNEIRQSSYIVYFVLFKNLQRVILGGFMAAAGVCVMHYVGMMAIRTDADLEWNIGLVFLSVVIAIVAASAGLFIMFRVLQFRPYSWLHFVCSIIIAIAVCGMHYTGMGAAKFVYHPGKTNWTTATVSNTNLEGISYGVFVICGLFDFWVRADLRHKQEVLDNEVSDLKNMIAQQHKSSLNHAPPSKHSANGKTQPNGASTMVGTATINALTSAMPNNSIVQAAAKDISEHNSRVHSDKHSAHQPGDVQLAVVAGMTPAATTVPSTPITTVSDRMEIHDHDDDHDHVDESRDVTVTVGQPISEPNSTAEPMSSAIHIDIGTPQSKGGFVDIPVMKS